MIFGLGLLPFSPSLRYLLLTLVVLTFGNGVTNPSITSLISQITGAEDQGGILGVTQSLASLARILGPAWGGFTFDRLGFQYPYVTGSIFMALAFAMSLVAVRRKIPVAHPA
jgi:predicted MFS family arabinose efflux permease